MRNQTKYFVMNHTNRAYEGFETLEEAELNLDGPEFELRACHPDGSYEILVAQTEYKS